MPKLAMCALAALGALPGLAAESVDSRLKPGEGYALSQTPSDSNGSGWVIRNENGLRVHVRMEKSSGKVPRPGDIVIIVRNINSKAGSAIIDADPAVNALRRFAPGSQIELNFFHDRQGRYGPTHLKVVKAMPVRATITGKVAEKLAEPGQVMIEVVSLPKDADGPKGVAVLFKVGDAPDPADKDKRIPDAEQLKALAGLKEGDAVEVAYRICPEFLTIESIRKAGDKDGPPAESPKPDPKDPKDPKKEPPPEKPPKSPEDDF